MRSKKRYTNLDSSNKEEEEEGRARDNLDTCRDSCHFTSISHSQVSPPPPSLITIIGHHTHNTRLTLLLSVLFVVHRKPQETSESAISPSSSSSCSFENENISASHKNTVIEMVQSTHARSRGCPSLLHSHNPHTLSHNIPPSPSTSGYQTFRKTLLVLLTFLAQSRLHSPKMRVCVLVAVCLFLGSIVEVRAQAGKRETVSRHTHDRMFPFKWANQKPTNLSHSTSDNQEESKFNSTSLAICKNCRLKLERSEAEKLKLEAIQRQILSKLNLQSPPNVSKASLPRELALQIVKKALIQARSKTHPEMSKIKRRRHSRNSRDEERLANMSLIDTRDHHHPAPEEQQDTDGNELGNDEYYGKTSEIIVPAEQGVNLNGHTLVNFVRPQANIESLEIVRATLWVRVISRQGSSSSSSSTGGGHNASLKAARFSSPVTLYIFSVDAHTGEPETSSKRSLFQLLKSQRIVKTGWKKLDITDAIREWVQQDVHQPSLARSNLTLLIDCNGCNNQIKLDMRSKRSKHSQALKPFLVIDTNNRRRRRSRRHAYDCAVGFKQCCKQSLYIDFAEIGWDEWIIYPNGYTANYCMGDCAQQRSPDVLAYFHSHVLEEYRTRNPYASIAPCCAPTKLTSISLIYLDQVGNIIKSDLPKMVVQECGCT